MIVEMCNFAVRFRGDVLDLGSRFFRYKYMGFVYLGSPDGVVRGRWLQRLGGEGDRWRALGTPCMKAFLRHPVLVCYACV